MKQICRSAILVAVVLTLAACGGGGGGQASSPASTKEAILALQQSGRLPTLDRSTDLAGPDTNSNGIRDDVDAFIAAQGYSAPQLKAAQQTAKALAIILLADTASQEALRASDLSLQKAIKCVFSQFPDVNQAAATAQEMQKITVNTKQRVDAYVKYQIAMNGKVLASPQGNTCE